MTQSLAHLSSALALAPARCGRAGWLWWRDRGCRHLGHALRRHALRRHALRRALPSGARGLLGGGADRLPTCLPTGLQLHSRLGLYSLFDSDKRYCARKVFYYYPHGPELD